MNEQFENSIKAHRRSLSRFHAQEMILDYAEGKLDPLRQEAMNEYLPRCKHTQAALSAVREALKYTDQLAQIEVGPNVVSQIENTKLGWDKWAEQLAWRNWPEVMRWSAEAVIIASIFAALISLVPMHKIARWLPKPAQEVVLAEVDKAKTVEPIRIVEIEQAPKESVPTKVAAPAPSQQVVAKPIAVPAAPVEKPTSPAVATSAPPTTETSPPPPVPVAKPTETKKVIVADEKAMPLAPVEVLNMKPDKTAEAELTEEGPIENTQPGKGPKGFVYRAFMSADDTETTTNTIRDIVLALGGEKAGKVELGWRKNTGTYFHFSIPESNYESLIEGLRAYSPVRIYKDPHWRVMPQGQIRIILFVEDLSLKK